MFGLINFRSLVFLFPLFLHSVLPPTTASLWPAPPSLHLCFRALQCWRLGDDVCDVADRVGCGCVCVWVLQPGGLQSLSGRWTRWEIWTHTCSDQVNPGSIKVTISCAKINSWHISLPSMHLSNRTLNLQNFFCNLVWMSATGDFLYLMFLITYLHLRWLKLFH